MIMDRNTILEVIIVAGLKKNPLVFDVIIRGYS